MTNKLFRTEKHMSREEASQRLKKISEKLGEGKLELKSGENSVILEPDEQVEFEIEVEQESDGDMSLEIEVEWSENSREDIEIK